MYGAADHLPGAYRRFRIELYNQRITYKGAWAKQAVVAAEGDVDTMLSHSLIQADHRFNIRPS